MFGLNMGLNDYRGGDRLGKAVRSIILSRYPMKMGGDASA